MRPRGASASAKTSGLGRTAVGRTTAMETQAEAMLT